jgi:hypothetical protein
VIPRPRMHERPDTVRRRGAVQVKGSNRQVQSRAATHGTDLEGRRTRFAIHNAPKEVYE